MATAETVTWHGAGTGTTLKFRSGTFALDAGAYVTGGIAITTGNVTTGTTFGSGFTTIKSMIFSEWGPYSFEFVPGATITDCKVKVHDITRSNANRPGHRHSVASHTHGMSAHVHTITEPNTGTGHSHTSDSHAHAGGAHSHAITASNFSHSHSSGTLMSDDAHWSTTPKTDSTDIGNVSGTAVVAKVAVTGITIADHGSGSTTATDVIYTGPSGAKAADALQTWSGTTSNASTEFAGTDLSMVTECTVFVVGAYVV
jgi:hypothetical protein